MLGKEVKMKGELVVPTKQGVIWGLNHEAGFEEKSADATLLPPSDSVMEKAVSSLGVSVS